MKDRVRLDLKKLGGRCIPMAPAGEPFFWQVSGQRA